LLNQTKLSKKEGFFSKKLNTEFPQEEAQTVATTKTLKIAIKMLKFSADSSSPFRANTHTHKNK
jgi:hypothetical protein